MRPLFQWSAVIVSAGALCVIGCSNSPSDSSNNMHAMGYKDTPPTPAAMPANAAAPGTPTVNNPDNPLPPGGLTVPPAAQTSPQNTPPNAANR